MVQIKLKKGEAVERALCGLAARTYGFGMVSCHTCAGVGWFEMDGLKYDCKTCKGHGCVPKVEVRDDD